MAAKKNYLYLGGGGGGGGGEKVNPSGSDFDFTEPDVWNSNEVGCSEPKRSIFKSHSKKNLVKKNNPANDDGKAARSLPVNVPGWSKLKNRRTENDDDDDRLPPHEYVARTKVASFSMQEGRGRTLKGRDMTRVRDAIWKKIGFED